MTTRILKKEPTTWVCDRTRKRYTQMFFATPKWLNEQQRADFYGILREAKRLNNMGFKVEVDHIVPIVSPLVCGLNVPWNLRIIASKINNKKGNRFWPDMPPIDLVGYDITQLEAPPRWQQLRFKI